jgi:hypothetical protein
LRWNKPGPDNANGAIGHPIYLGEKTMPNQATPNLGTTEKPSTLDVHTPESGEDKKIDRVAERAAEKAGKTEKSYDSDHGIFTK